MNRLCLEKEKKTEAKIIKNINQRQNNQRY